MLRMRWRNGTVDRGGDRDLVAEHRAHDADGAQKLRAQKCHIYMPSSSILCRMPGKPTLGCNMEMVRSGPAGEGGDGRSALRPAREGGRRGQRAGRGRRA